MTQQHIDAYREELRERFESGREDVFIPEPLRDPRDWRVRFEERWERDLGALPSTFPAYGRLLLGDDGVLWVQDYPRPGQSAAWRAFDGGGEEIRSLVLPAEARLLDIGADWALVRTRDEHDVERLAVHVLVEG